MSNFDDLTNSGNFTWTNSTATTANFTSSAGTNFTFVVNGTSYHPVIPDKNWMPYQYFEYEPKWHIKYASYKNQMEHMWD